MTTQIDLICYTCKYVYSVDSENTLKGEDKNCPECGSSSYRQTFASYRRNGSLIDPKWACLGGGGTHFG